jgi:hypothetical protein
MVVEHPLYGQTGGRSSQERVGEHLMHDNFDIAPIDPESMAEIDTMADLMIAATGNADRLAVDTIDRILLIPTGRADQ